MLWLTTAVVALLVFCPSGVPVATADDTTQAQTLEPAQTSSASTETASQPAPQGEVVSHTPQDTPASEAPASSAPGNVTVDFKDADIQNVLRIISFKSGVNIVAGKDVTGTVTIRLVDVPWEKALDVVLKTYGYAYDRDENIIRVTTLENLKREELSTEVFVLDYALASDVEKALKDVLSERGKVRSDVRSNTVIVTDMATTIQRAQAVVARLDKQTPQVMISTKVIETTLGDADKLGIDWRLKAKVSGSATPTTFPFTHSDQTGSMISQFLPIGRVSTTTAVADGSGTVDTATTEDFPAAELFPQPTFPVADKAEFKFGTIDFSEFQAILEILQERDDTKILSEPHVVTLNNQEAKILVGDVIAIPTFERNASTGRMEITGYKDRDVGIRLTVTPQINAQNEIVVAVQPEITSLVGYDELTQDIKAPHFTTRSAKTQVRIQNGQTIAIGGLIREDTVKHRSKVPILGDIPLLGMPFKFDSKVVVKTDILFFMTVNVVTDKAVPQGHNL